MLSDVCEWENFEFIFYEGVYVYIIWLGCVVYKDFMVGLKVGMDKGVFIMYCCYGVIIDIIFDGIWVVIKMKVIII